MMGAMALKEDLQAAQLETIKELKAFVSIEVQPLRSEVNTLRSRIDALERHGGRAHLMTPSGFCDGIELR